MLPGFRRLLFHPSQESLVNCLVEGAFHCLLQVRAGKEDQALALSIEAAGKRQTYLETLETAILKQSIFAQINPAQQFSLNNSLETSAWKRLS